MNIPTVAGQAPLPALPLLRLMALAREGDRREGILMRQGKGWFQVSGTGHETLAALVMALRPDDYLFPYYRDRAPALAKGLTNYDLALAYFARRESSSGGRQMPGHYSDRARNIFSVATPTASQCLPATGAAWAGRLAGTDQVVMTTVGDAATRQGEFYEAVAFAIQEKLPVLFVIEDNRFGISTPTDAMMPYRLGILGEETLVRIDSRDAFALYEAGQNAVARARLGEGPTVLWCEMDRLCSHTSSDDHRLYRGSEEIALERERDPLELLAQRLIEAGELEADAWQQELIALVEQVDADYRRAEAAASPDPAQVLEHLVAEPNPVCPLGLSFAEPTTMVAAINRTLQLACAENPQTILFGEDIEDPKGGVFGLTKGLSTQFPKRVFNAPLAEATILGAAVGLASAGFRPIVEMQFIDFLPPALNQLMTQAASLRWRTCGDWQCPLVILAPYGAYLPGGSIWHSASNEGMWAHIPGIRTVVPSTPEDAAGLLWTAIHADDPTLILLPKHIFRKRQAVSEPFAPVPFGVAKTVRSGEDVTLVSWGNCMELAVKAAEVMQEEEGVGVEVIDLRSIVPCDYAMVTASLARTGRLVVVHEDSRTTGFGQSLIAEMVTHEESFNSLLALPQLVARADTHVPFHPDLEHAVLPDLNEILEAIRVTLR
jgi:2-oxoisovalerate dehydrogenase E1 component